MQRNDSSSCSLAIAMYQAMYVWQLPAGPQVQAL